MSRKNANANKSAQPDLFATQWESTAAPPAANDAAELGAHGEPDPLKSDEQERQRAIDSSRGKAAISSKVSVRRSPHLLDVRAAAAWLGLSKSTLDKMRCYGVGPRFIRATGRAVRYDPADLAAFAEGRRQSRTTDELPA
jgi:predicted DNA-binding transcriptional regulator AlpA